MIGNLVPPCYVGIEKFHRAKFSSHLVDELYNRAPKKSEERLILIDNPEWNQLLMESKQLEKEERLEEAEKRLLSALHVSYSFSLNDPRLSSTLTLVACFYHRLGDYKNAEKYFLVHSRLMNHSFGKSAPEVAASLSRLGGTYYNLGAYDSAAACFRRSLSIHVNSWGRYSLPTVRSAQNLALCLQAVDNKKAALKYCSYALRISARLLGKGHHISNTLREQCLSLKLSKSISN